MNCAPAIITALAVSASRTVPAPTITSSPYFKATFSIRAVILGVSAVSSIVFIPPKRNASTISILLLSFAPRITGTIGVFFIFLFTAFIFFSFFFFYFFCVFYFFYLIFFFFFYFFFFF